MCKQFTLIFAVLLLGAPRAAAQFLLSKRIQVDVQTAQLKLEKAYVIKAAADTLSLGVAESEQVFHITVSDLEFLRVHRPSQWRRGLWVGAILGLPVVRAGAGLADNWFGALGGIVMSGLATAHGHSKRLDLATIKGANMREAYTYLYPWLKRAALHDSPKLSPPPTFSEAYHQHPYLRPRKLRITQSWGWASSHTHEALRQIVALGGNARAYNEYVWSESGGHLHIQAGYSLNPYVNAGTWAIPQMAWRATGYLVESFDLGNNRRASLSGILSYRLQQSAMGLYAALSPIRDDRRHLYTFIPRLEGGIWTSYIRANNALKTYGSGNGLARFEERVVQESRHLAGGSYLAGTLDWYLTRHIILSSKFTYFFHLNPRITIAEVSNRIESLNTEIGTPATPVVLPRYQYSIGLGIRI